MGASASSPFAANIPHQSDHAALRDCSEGALDIFACIGRGCIDTGRETGRYAKKAAYPVKEAAYAVSDKTNEYFHPWQRSKARYPVVGHVGKFSRDGTGSTRKWIEDDGSTHDAPHKGGLPTTHHGGLQWNDGW